MPKGFMSLLLRNRSVQVHALLLLALTIMTVAICAFFVRDRAACAIVAVFGAVVILAHVLFSLRRHREIARLAEEVDLVLHEGRTLSLSACKEGDVEVLRNEIAKMTAQLARVTSSLEAEKSSLADAMADISHQIRTPLTTLSCLVPALERAEDLAERKRVCREVETSLDRISWLVSSLLRMAKADAGALAVEQRPVFVKDAVSRATRMLEAAFDVRGVELIVDIDDAVSFVGDERWSAEALQNIVKNCLEHTPAGGFVRINACEDVLATRIVVTDSGCGIAPEELPHLFERFYRGSHASTHDEGTFASEGFGIGLSLARSLVSVQNGTLRAANVESGGARFEVAFPKLTV